ncbi:MAG: hypothetical protein M0Z49_13365 [Chloroflexi bacterium]|nr:hypothetical protein [Chloroflexota bacterium]
MERYEIEVEGRITARRAAALGCAFVEATPEHTLLRFDAADAAALYGLVARLRDAGLELVAITRTPAASCDAPGTTGGPR